MVDRWVGELIDEWVGKFCYLFGGLDFDRVFLKFFCKDFGKRFEIFKVFWVLFQIFELSGV